MVRLDIGLTIVESTDFGSQTMIMNSVLGTRHFFQDGTWSLVGGALGSSTRKDLRVSAAPSPCNTTQGYNFGRYDASKSIEYKVCARLDDDGLVEFYIWFGNLFERTVEGP